MMLIHWEILCLNKIRIPDDVDWLGNTLPDKIKISDDVDLLGNTLPDKIKITDNVYSIWGILFMIRLKSQIMLIYYRNDLPNKHKISFDVDSLGNTTYIR